MSAFHAAFIDALRGDAAAKADGFAAQAAFAVYRNTVMKGCIDALEANFPAVAQLVGPEWFRSAAAAYAQGQWPADARLLAYGDEGFADFLAGLPTTAELPYLAAVARLDTLWRSSHRAEDAPVLSPEILAGDSAQELAGRVLEVHPATRWAWFDDTPAGAIWLAVREGLGRLDAVPWQGGGLLLTRPRGAVLAAPLDAGGCAFLDACRAGRTLGEAAQDALDRHCATDIAALLQTVLHAGAFTPSQDRP